MPRRSSSYRTPREWIADGVWPEGTFEPDSPTAVAYAVEIARRLEQGMGDRSKAGVAREANLERSTLYDLLSGRSWPDAITIAQLEQVLQTRLWPDHPVPPLRS
ncbi:MAG: helix-turn-helix transcriptional regulator [Micrococcales bacterium]|nr:helix-turn-helix transcriptional regulator [Micrococcales bacterium]